MEQEFQLEGYSNDFELKVTLKNLYYKNFGKILYRSEKIGIINSKLCFNINNTWIILVHLYSKSITTPNIMLDFFQKENFLN